MAQASATKPYFTFVKGIVTDAGPLTYPENASIDEANFILNKDGSRQRRLGIDYELGYSLVDTANLYTTLQLTGVSAFNWKGVGGRAEVSFNCVQYNNKLYFFDTEEVSQSASLRWTLEISSSTLYERFSYAQIHGNLVIASSEIGPILITPTFSNGVFLGLSKSTINIYIRDLFGIEDGHAVDFRPTTLSSRHKYNLLNQGWPEATIFSFYTSKAVYPSNADIWHLAKDASNNFSADFLVKTDFGSSQAPKGRFTINAFNRGEYRSGNAKNAPKADDIICSYIYNPLTLGYDYVCEVVHTYPTTITGIPSDVEYGKISCVASYSGRVFYSGVTPNLFDGDTKSPSYSGIVFYSVLSDSKSEVGNCYSYADPTSEEISDVIASDGGFINILEAYNIVAMKEMAGKLFVFAENGVWAIGGTDKGFSAVENTLKKVTDIGCIGKNSIVVVDGSAIIYWAEDGIYSISGDDVSGIVVNNITASVISSLYENIPSICKRNVKGAYDKFAKKIRWLYSNSTSYSLTEPYKFDKELILDTVLQAYYVNTIDNSSIYAADYIELTGEVKTTITYGVVVGVDSVVVGASSVVVTDSFNTIGNSGIKYLTIIPNTAGTAKITFSLFKNDGFLDWYSHDSIGKNYSSYLVTGYEILQDSMRQKAAPYATFHLKRTEQGVTAIGGDLYPVNPSSCKVTAYWDFADDATSGKVGQQFQAYKYPRNFILSGPSDTLSYGQSVITTKNRLRGNGRALSLKIESEPGKNMHLYGWSVLYEGRTSV